MNITYTETLTDRTFVIDIIEAPDSSRYFRRYYIHNAGVSLGWVTRADGDRYWHSYYRDGDAVIPGVAQETLKGAAWIIAQKLASTLVSTA